MSNLWKRVLSVLLAVVMVVAGMPSMGAVQTVQADNPTWDGYSWPPYDFGTTAGGWSLDTSNKVRFNIGSGSSGIAEDSAKFITSEGNRLWRKYEQQYGHDTWWVDLTDAATIKTGQQKDLINYIAEVKDKMYFTLVNSNGWSPESAGWYGMIYSPVDTTKAEGLEIKADKGWWRDAGWPYVDFSGDSSKKHATHVGAIMWVENNDGQNKLHIQMYTTWVWEDGVWTGPNWTWEGVTSATAKYHNSQGSQGELDFPWTGTPVASESGGDVTFTATADFETQAGVYHFKPTESMPAHPTSSKTFSPEWTWDGIWADATNLGTNPTASVTYTLKSHTGNISDLDANESYTLNATVVPAKTGSTGAKLSATASSSFGETIPIGEKNYSLTWGSWSADHQSISATFTNTEDSTETYVVNQAAISQVGSKNRATVYFCGLQFTTDSDDLTPHYSQNSWTWSTYDAAQDAFDATLILNKTIGTTPDGTVSVNGSDTTETYTKVDATTLSMDATATYDNANYQTSPNYTKVMKLTSWNWAEDYMSATATFKNQADQSEVITLDATVTHDTPIRKVENDKIRYDWKHYASVTFCGKEFTTDYTEENLQPDIVIVPSEDEERSDSMGWTWEPYSQSEDNFTANLSIIEVIERYSALVPEGMSASLWQGTLTDEDTVITAESQDGGPVRIQGVATHGESEFKSAKRTFDDVSAAFDANFTKCTFTFNEIGGTTGDEDNLEENSIIRDTTTTGSTIEPITGLLDDELNPGKLKKQWRATVKFGKQTFTHTEWQRNIEPGEYQSVWNWSEYIKADETTPDLTGDKAGDKYYAGYTIYPMINGVQSSVAADQGTVNPVQMTKNTDNTTTLTASITSQIAGNTTFTETRTVKAPVWNWSSTAGSEYMTATATFKEDWTNGKEITLTAQVTHDKPVSNSDGKTYDWTHHATVTFCRNTFTTEFTETKVIPDVVVVTPTPTPVPSEVTPTPTPGLDETDSYEKKTASDSWVWDTYSMDTEEIPATATVVERIERWTSVAKNAAEADLHTETLTDNVTANRTKSADNGTVYFQGEVKTSRDKTVTSGERSFTHTAAWNDEVTACTFTFTEPATGYTLNQTYRILARPENGKLTYGPYEESVAYVGKFRRKATATVTFGHKTFTAETYQDNLDPGTYAEWVWSAYDAANDKYTASYAIKSSTNQNVTLEAGTVDVYHGSTSAGCDAEKGTNGKTTLKASVTSAKYGTFSDTKTVEAPVFTWASDYMTLTSVNFVETTGIGTSTPATIDRKGAATITHEKPVVNADNTTYDWTHRASTVFCRNDFADEKVETKIVPDVVVVTPTPTPTPVPSEVTPTPTPGLDETDSYEKKTASDGWVWDTYSMDTEEIPATATVVERIERWTSVAKNAAEADLYTETLTDNVTANKTKSVNNGTVYFQGEVQTTRNKTVTSGERSFTHTAAWNDEVTACTFTFTEPATGYTLNQTYRILARPENGKLAYGPYEESVAYVGKFRRKATATVTFGHKTFTAETYQDNLDPGTYAEWVWSAYDAANDKYTASYAIKSSTNQNVTLEAGTVDVYHGSTSAGCDAVKNADKSTTLTASVVSAKYGTFGETKTVNAPNWTWVNHSKGRVYADFRETWGNQTTVNIDATVTPGTEYVPAADGSEMYVLTHSASLTFCGNPFDDEDNEDITPTYDKQVTPTPTPVGFTPTPTPTVGPGTPTPMPEDQKSIITWAWDDYEESLNGRDSSGHFKGSFSKATATLHDDQRGFFVKSYTADGKKTGNGGISITSPATAINPANITFTAAVQHTTSKTTKTLTDALKFELPSWEWHGNTAATATFTESTGKEFGSKPTTQVAIRTEDITHEPGLYTTTYIANAYFGERHYQDTKVVNTDYVVYLRWPSSWGKNPRDVYCYVHDELGHDNGTTQVGGKAVKGELMTMVTEKTKKFFNYPLAKGDLVDPVVEFYDENGTRLSTPDVQYVEGVNATDITELKMTALGDWIYYEATIETTATKNTWKKYIPEINAHSLTVLESGIIGLNFKYELPERYAGNGGTLSFTVPTLAAYGEGETRFSYGNNDRSQDGRFVFRRNIRAYRMADTVHAVFNYGNGGQVLDDFSVEDYLTEMIGRADQGVQRFVELRDVLCALNDYGSYSQTGLANTAPYVPVKKIYNTPALPTKETILNKLSKYEAQVLNQGSTVEDITYRLQCWEDIRINIYLKAPRASSVTAEIISKDDPETGGVFSPVLSAPTYQMKGGAARYFVSVQGIPLDALEKSVTVRITLDGQVTDVKVCALSAPLLLLSTGMYDSPDMAESLKQALGIVNVWRELYKYFNNKDMMA